MICIRDSNIRRCLLGACLLLVFLLPAPPDSSAQTSLSEPIRGDLRNLRGFNFVAIYPSLNQLATSGAPAGFFNGVEWKGVASSTAMWEYYDTSANGTWNSVDTQLGLIHSIGANSVRVFMSLPAFLHYESQPGPNEYIRRFQHFLDLCAQNNIHCVPVIWDNTGAGSGRQPNYEQYYSEQNLQGWHSNPGLEFAQALVGVEGVNEQSLIVENYVTALANAVVNKPAFLMWDLINESTLPADVNLELCTRTLDVLEDVQPEQKTILGHVFAFADVPFDSENLTIPGPHYQLISDSRIDAHAVHSYSTSRDFLRSMIYDATHIVDRSGPTPLGFLPPKPVVVTELGSSGNGYHYADAIEDAMNVRRDDLTNGVDPEPEDFTLGVGFFSFSSNVGWDQGNYPFKHESGVFYGNGTVRDLKVVEAHNQAALHWEVVPSRKTDEFQTTAAGQPGFVLQGPIPLELDESEIHSLLLQLTSGDFYAMFELLPYETSNMEPFARYLQMRQVFKVIENGLASTFWFSSRANGNPYNSVGAPNGVMLLQDILMASNMGQEFRLVRAAESDPPNPSVWEETELIFLIEQATNRTFDIENDNEHLKLHASITLSEWASFLSRFYEDQQDNID